ncbi:MAG TPA: hypothetical protein VEK74_13330 [Burkholderiaceae bacterium]|nr:hypothetical protein [Burkholderiaceae bacterium]
MAPGLLCLITGTLIIVTSVKYMALVTVARFLCIGALGIVAIFSLVLRYGFRQYPDLAVVRAHCCPDGQGFDLMRATFFLSRKMVDNKLGQRFKGIERRLFIWMPRNVTDATEIFRLPRNRIVELGARIEL